MFSSSTAHKISSLMASNPQRLRHLADLTPPAAAATKKLRTMTTATDSEPSTMKGAFSEYAANPNNQNDKRERIVKSSRDVTMKTATNIFQESIQAAVESKSYEKIPQLLLNSKTPNPFSFLSSLPTTERLTLIDSILQSFIPLRPRSLPRLAYSHLLSHTLQSPNPLPLALAVLQRTLRSGCLPHPQTHLLLSQAWAHYRLTHPAATILSQIHSIGYTLDSGTCNYLIRSLCKVDRIEEAVRVLKAMAKAGSPPDSDSFGVLICEMSERGMKNEVVEMVKEMVKEHGLNPRKEVIVKAAGALDAWRAVEMVEFLEGENVGVGFEAYEVVLEGILEARQFVLGGKFVLRMTGKGFIPYIRFRQRLVEGLVGVGEIELASVVRRRFSELNS